MDRTGRGMSLLLLTLLALPGATRAAAAPFDIDISELDRGKPAAAALKVTRVSTTAEREKRGDARGARAKKKGAAERSDYLRYTVKPGDTIYKILMARLGMTNDEADRLIPEISRINKISNIRKLRVGQTLLIPVPEKGKKGGAAPHAVAAPSAPAVPAPGGPGTSVPPASATGAPPPGGAAPAAPTAPAAAPGQAPPTTTTPAPAAPGPAAQPAPPVSEPAGEKAEPEGAQPEQAQPEEVVPEQAEPEKGEPEQAEPENGEPAKGEPAKGEPEEGQLGDAQPETQPMAQGAGKGEPGKAQPERPQSEEESAGNGQSDSAASGSAAPVAAAQEGATPGAAVGGAAAPETAAAPAFVPPLVCSITDKDPAKIVEAVLNALSIPSTANKVIESAQGAESYGVKADRYFEYKGGRYIVSIGDTDPYNYTMIRLLEKAGYRVLVLGASDDFTVVAEKVLRLVGVSYDYSRNLLPGVNQAATGYLVQQGAVAGGRRVLITRDQVDARQQWVMKPGCLAK